MKIKLLNDVIAYKYSSLSTKPNKIRLSEGKEFDVVKFESDRVCVEFSPFSIVKINLEDCEEIA